MKTIYDTFIQRYDEWLIALGQHLQISLIAILLAVLIAVPLAIFILKYKKLTEGLLQISGILQTIPSLALLGLFIPIMGIGTLPAIVALTLYAIFPILQNTITGFYQIDPNLEEAAEAFGLNRFEKLRKYQIALALPVIISGIRTSAVLVIGTATLAALIGAGGMGSFILLGIDRNNSDLILIGAISSAIIAVVFNYLIKKMETMPLKKIIIIFMALLIGVSASYSNKFFGKEEETITVAGKLGPEPEILMNMYKLLIEEATDLKVEVKPNFGKTTFIYEALKGGDIDIYTEYTGTIVTSLLNKAPELSNDPQEVYETAKESIREQDDLVLLDAMAFQNTYALAVRNDYAKQNNLTQISDLSRVEETAKAGFTLEFNDREDGVLGLRDLYGLNLNVATMEPSLRYQALLNDDVQIIETYSTDGEIAKYDLVLLKDDKKLFPPYQGAPLLRAETLEKHPELKDILNQLGGKITEEQMARMNYEVLFEEKPASQVAKAYLEASNLLGNQ
ncbi:ABC transporter permease/substrate-binding protein [Facklamia miroungae]|uniref:Osmoprotectant transport system permease protein n=1 Tax=Facklamia miroungae TaxID=120956 RepID=A0A1G7QAL9_9LACT|nr:ABC transporter permease/substrate-binding protein [Facklamia miroungae]NKZ28881.1 ABC transporter permease/substrate-binding protein [Facklamia miroungae]SDF95576.1 osmoprotectant transport system permease protein [Facklamia miroungae]